MKTLEQSIYTMLVNFHNQDKELESAISFCEKEIKNTTQTEGYSLEEKVLKLTELKNELQEKKTAFLEMRTSETTRLKKMCDERVPELWNYVQAKFLTDLMFSGHI